jgi:hypothetical protein
MLHRSVRSGLRNERAFQGGSRSGCPVPDDDQEPASARLGGAAAWSIEGVAPASRLHSRHSWAWSKYPHSAAARPSGIGACPDTASQARKRWKRRMVCSVLGGRPTWSPNSRRSCRGLSAARRAASPAVTPDLPSRLTAARTPGWGPAESARRRATAPVRMARHCSGVAAVASAASRRRAGAGPHASARSATSGSARAGLPRPPSRAGSGSRSRRRCRLPDGEPGALPGVWPGRAARPRPGPGTRPAGAASAGASPQRRARYKPPPR